MESNFRSLYSAPTRAVICKWSFQLGFTTNFPDGRSSKLAGPLFWPVCLHTHHLTRQWGGHQGTYKSGHYWPVSRSQWSTANFNSWCNWKQISFTSVFSISSDQFQTGQIWFKVNWKGSENAEWFVFVNSHNQIWIRLRNCRSRITRLSFLTQHQTMSIKSTPGAYIYFLT